MVIMIPNIIQFLSYNLTTLSTTWLDIKTIMSIEINPTRAQIKLPQCNDWSGPLECGKYWIPTPMNSNQN